MIYKNFKGKSLSMLGLGCMRLPGDGRFSAVIDEEATAEMVDFAFKKGLNYFDTAFGYHGQQSEVVMGKILKNYPRESFYLATKFPGFSADYTDKIEEVFEKQLEKLQTDYVDFYLFHNLNDGCIEQYLNPKYRMMQYMKEQKAKGRIKHIGVSVHSSHESLERFLDAYGDDIEFCQLQLNFLDWDYQDVKAKVKMLNDRNIPIWVMEPLRGGKLAAFPEKHEAKLKSMRPDEIIPAWSFRFLQAIEGVTVVLSGMSNMEQLSQNIEIFETEKPVLESEKQVLFGIAKDLLNSVPCTACSYCVDTCPSKINIPEIIKIYNKHIFSGNPIKNDEISHIPEENQPKSCISCRVCEGLCPQNIEISDIMTKFVEKTSNI